MHIPKYAPHEIGINGEPTPEGLARYKSGAPTPGYEEQTRQSALHIAEAARCPMHWKGEPDGGCLCPRTCDSCGEIYTGYYHPVVCPKKSDYVDRDRKRGKAFLDAFIVAVNADHLDVIPVSRTKGCYMRDEIERLRKAAGEEPKPKNSVCHVCKTPTEFACSDCRINFSATVYVCGTRACRMEHDRKCAGDGHRETQKSTSQWIKDTFPEYQGKENRFVALLEEVVELGLEAGVSPETIRNVIEIPIRKEIERGNTGDRERNPLDLCEEVGDVLMNVFSFAEEAGIEAQVALDAKMYKNRLRPASYYRMKTQQKKNLGMPLIQVKGTCICLCHKAPINAATCGTQTNMLHESCC